MIVQVVGGQFVDLSELPVAGIPVGSTVTDVVGAHYRLEESDDVVDHDLVESVAGEPTLRWIETGIVSVNAAVALANVPEGTVIPFTFPSATINLALLAATATVVPALGAGLYLIQGVSRIAVATRNEAVVTAPSAKTGTNGAHDNYGTAAIASNTNLNAVAAPMSITASLTTTAGTPTLELSAPLVTEITVAGTSAGTLAMTGRFIFTGNAIAL